jgi:hypothetical protein
MEPLLTNIIGITDVELFAVGVTTAVFVQPFTVLVVKSVYDPGAVIEAVD